MKNSSESGSEFTKQSIEENRRQSIFDEGEDKPTETKLLNGSSINTGTYKDSRAYIENIGNLHELLGTVSTYSLNLNNRV